MPSAVVATSSPTVTQKGEEVPLVGVTQPAASVTSATKIVHSPRSTSINDLLKRDSSVVEVVGETDAPQGEGQPALPFSQQALIQCWDAYSETIEKMAHLKNTMINCKPVLLDHERFEVLVFNPGQKEELTRNAECILNFLRLRLKNDQLQMNVRVDESKVKRVAYTSSEKYAVLCKLNPLMEKLKSEFNLTID